MDLRQILDRETIPETGLLIADTWATSGFHKRADAADAILAAIDAMDPAPLAKSSGSRANRRIDVVAVSPRHWATRDVDWMVGDEEVLIFASYEDAYAHYEQVVRGQQDATSGGTWTETDVPGVLAGTHLDLARRVGLTYEQAADAYAADTAAAVAAWRTLDALSEAPDA